MEIIDLPKGSLAGDAYSSRGVAMTSVAAFGADTDARVHIAWCEPNSVLGSHRAGRHQLFAAISGSGWVPELMASVSPSPMAKLRAMESR